MDRYVGSDARAWVATHGVLESNGEKEKLGKKICGGHFACADSARRRFLRLLESAV